MNFQLGLNNDNVYWKYKLLVYVREANAHFFQFIPEKARNLCSLGKIGCWKMAWKKTLENSEA